MAWIFLVAAGWFEIGWAIGLKFTDGVTRLWPPVGTAYAVWTGVGTVGTAILGMILFGESAAVARLVCIGLILAGMAGRKLASPA